jgi:hypothetical protein
VTTNHVKNFTGLNITFLATATFRFNDFNSTISEFPILGDITINAPGGTVSLQDNVFPSPFTLGTTKTLTLTAGTFSVNGRPVSTGRFSSNGTSTRVYSTASGSPGVLTIELTSTTAGATVLDMANATGFSYTISPGPGRPIFVRNQAATATMVFGTTGGTTSNACNLTVNGGASALTLTSGSYFGTTNFTGSTCTVTATSLNLTGSLTLASGGTYTSVVPTFRGNAIITSNGKELSATTVNGSGITVTLADAMLITGASGFAFTLTQGTINLAGFTLTAPRFSSSGSNTRAINFGSGGGITLTERDIDLFRMDTATNFTRSGTGGITLTGGGGNGRFSFGTTGGATSSNVLDLTITTSAGLVVEFPSGSSVRSINCPSGNPSLQTISGTTNLYGNLTLIAGVGSIYPFSPTFLASATVTSNGMTLRSTTVNGSGITVTLADAMTLGTDNTFTLTEGTLDLAGFTLSAGTFSSSNSNTRAISFGSGNIALTSTTAATTVLSMATATGFTWTGTGEFTRNQAATATMVFGTSGGTTSNAPNLTVNAGASALTFTTSSWFRDINFTGSTCAPTGSINNVGNLTLASGGTYTTLALNFRASATITSTGRTVNGVQVNASGGTVTLADAMTILSNGTFTLTRGTFTAANFDVTAGLFSSSNSDTRTLNMGSGTWTISGSGATAWNTATTTGLTVVPSTSTITMTNASAKTFAGGGVTYYNLNQGGAGALTISGSNTFNNITNSTQPATVTFTAGTTQTVSAFGLSGTAGNLITINSTTPGSQFTLSDASGTINAQYLSIRDSNATGGAVWNALYSTNLGNNTGWIFPGGNMFLMFI